MELNFKNKYNFEERYKEAHRIMCKYSDYIPIVCEQRSGNSDIYRLKKVKFLLPKEMYVHSFISVVRNQLQISPNQALIFFINNKMVSMSMRIADVYEQNKESCGFLFVTYSLENTFG